MPKLGILVSTSALGEERFKRILDAMAGKVSAPEASPARPTAEQGGGERMWRAIEELERRVAELEAELRPSSRNRKCPHCRSLAVSVIATCPHPEFGDEGIELHDVECAGCGYRGDRLHDPSGYIC